MRYHVNNIFSSAQGQITPKLTDGCGRNSNPTKFLCLSWLPASLVMMWSTMRVQLWPQHFLWYKSMGKIFYAQVQVTPKRIVQSGPKSNLFKILYLQILVICKSEEDPIKTEGAMISCPQHFFQCSRIGNSEVNGQMWPEFKLVQNSMAVLVTCKFDDDTIKWGHFCVHNIFCIISLWEKIRVLKCK